MKINYYTRHYSFIFPIFIVYVLLGGCNKLQPRYGGCGKPGKRYHTDPNAYYNQYHNPYKMDQDPIRVVNEGDSSSHESNMDYSLLPSPWLQELFSAVTKRNVSKVTALLSALHDSDLGKLCEMDPRNMYNCLHMAAAHHNNDLDKRYEMDPGNRYSCPHMATAHTGDDDAIAIMKLLLDKMLPLLLSKEGLESLLCEEGKLSHFVQGSRYWNEGTIKHAITSLQAQGYYNNSMLLWSNDAQETPLLIAMKRGSLAILALLLKYTHQCVGLNLTDHTDEQHNDFLDVALQQKCACKLHHIMWELWRCSERFLNLSCMHFSGMSKCQSEGVIQAVISNNKKLKCLFKAVHNKRLAQIVLILSTINIVLGRKASVTILIKEYPCKPYGYTLLHTALDKNLLEEQDKDTIKILAEFLRSTMKDTSAPLPKSLAQKLIDMLEKGNLNLRDLAAEHGLEHILSILADVLRKLTSTTPPGQFYMLDMIPSEQCMAQAEEYVSLAMFSHAS